MKKELSRLVRLLASGEHVSGRLIGEEIGVSRTSVSKWVAQLNDYGIAVTSQAGVGYCLTHPLRLLHPEALQARVYDETQRVFSLEVLDSADSTNTHALASLQHYLGGRSAEISSTPAGVSKFTVVIAEHQRAGRGRRGRSWISPYAANINLSLGVRVYRAMNALSGLSLAIGMAIVKVLRRHGFREAGLKWPNDVLVEGRKLAGVLVDAQGEMDGPVDLCVGVGLNVHMQASEVEGKIGQPWVSLEEVAAEKHIPVPERSLLAADLISEIVATSDLFMLHGFAYFQSAWPEYDAFDGEMLALTTQIDPESAHLSAESSLPATLGRSAGVDEQGRLLLRQEDQLEPVAFSGGEVSLRRHRSQQPESVPVTQAQEGVE